jgi:fatty-acid peroxygenase
MTSIPRDRGIDKTLALKREPYEYISKQCRRLDTDVFVTRFLGRKTLCLRGREAAELFYNPQYFVRRGATPGVLQKNSHGATGVQTLDDAAHRHRKAMFLALMSERRIAALGNLFRQELQRSVPRWSQCRDIVLYDELQPILTRCVCAWASVPIQPGDLPKRSMQLTALLDDAGRAGLKRFRARRARRHAEHWIASLIDSVRARTLVPREDSALERIAHHRDLDDQLLPAEVAAVELLNVLRPTVAVSVYIVFLTHALHRFPDSRVFAERGEAAVSEAFVHEVRRYYPFFPAVPARVRDGFSWNGYRFDAGTRALLDLHGINHDERIWQAPDAFRSQRFLRWDGDAYAFVPQGGGDHLQNHRCPGEWLTIELMRQALGFLTADIQYRVPEQDLTIDAHRLPAMPRSRMVLRNVRVRRD